MNDNQDDHDDERRVVARDVEEVGDERGLAAHQHSNARAAERLGDVRPAGSRIASTAASLCVSVASPVSGISTSVTLPSSLTRGSNGAPRCGSSAISAVRVSIPCCTSGSSGVPRIASCAGALRARLREVLDEGEERLLGLDVVRQRRDAGQPLLDPATVVLGVGLQPERERQDDQEAGREHEADHRPRHDGPAGSVPEAPGRPCSICSCLMRRESHDDSLRSQRVRPTAAATNPRNPPPRRDHRVLRPRMRSSRRPRHDDHAQEREGVRGPGHPRPVEPVRTHRFAGVPSRLRTAGRSVIEAATETSTTMMAPPARPRKIVVGTRSMPESAITTVRPLKKTARFAVAPERPIERSLSPPFGAPRGTGTR